MSPGRGLSARMDDWFNPIVVKELRQAVNGKFVSAVLILLLIVQLAALGIFIVANGDFSNDFTAGTTAFMILEGILLGISLLFVPAYTGIRLAVERSDTNVDLLFITTLRPIAIVAGKLFSALVITMLIFSACMPFMAFTWFLRNIDLPAIFILLALSFLVVATTIQFTTFIACLPAGRVLKILVALLALGTFPNLFFGTLTASFWLLQRNVIGGRLGTWDFWGPATAVLLVALAVNGILFALSVALVTPPTANRALPVRVLIMAIWLVSLAVTAVISYSFRDIGPLTAWAIISAVVFSAAALVAVSERETLGPRVARKIPSGGLPRAAAFVLFSGGANGLVWCALMTALTFATILLWPSLFNIGTLGRSSDAEVWVAGLFLYFFAYATTALFIRRTFVSKWIGHKYTWAIAMLLLAVGCILPALLSYLLFFDSWRAERHGMWLVGNPFVFGIQQFQGAYLAFAGAWATIGALVNLPWFVDQMTRFRPWQSDKAVENE
ncbi:MAG TPA: hypothetical protein VFV34_26660 [Blastocatellia bacterium]|nr:hypothetical protein [Blastocatellia bacterium]